MPRFLLVTIVCAALFFAWGAATVRYHVFPWNLIHPVESEIRDFVKGDLSEKTGVAEKISNDLALRPSRQLFEYRNERADRHYQSVDIPGSRNRRASASIYVSGQEQPLEGYRFIFGTFDFRSHLHGGILLDPANNIVNTWVVDEPAIRSFVEGLPAADRQKNRYKPPARRLPQGVVIFPDGSIVFNDGDRGNAMHRMDRCGNTLWSAAGHYHHSITYEEDGGTLWTFGPGDMMQLDPGSGEVPRTISLNDINLANPGLSIFTPRRHLERGKWHYDPIHKNDIEALGKTIAGDFPLFDAGDLLVSHRATNLLFVFDPDTLEVKWWVAGRTRRQHDPDWQPGGGFTVFDNNLKENYGEYWDGYLPDGEERFSRIWKIVPHTHSSRIVYDGKLDNMYSGERSKHQVLSNGNILITSAHQGRIIEVTAEGETVFEFLNHYDDTENLILSEAIWLPPDYFEVEFSDHDDCPGGA